MQKNEGTVVESIPCIYDKKKKKALRVVSFLISTGILMEFVRGCTFPCLGIPVLARGH